MANFLINSAAVSVTGTEDKDLFQILSGASAVTVAGLGADDTFTFSSVAAATPFTFGSSVVQAGAGNDTLNVTTAVSLSATSIGGGEGKDTINFGDNNGEASYNGFTVNGGQANDILNFAADITGTASAFSINGGLEDDSINIFSAGGASVKSGLIGGGKGDDFISAESGGTYAFVTVNGGLGEDSIFFSAATLTGVVINGGQNNVTDAEADSADIITLAVSGGALNGTVLGNGGDDTITISAVVATGFSIGGGQNIDDIDVAFNAASGVTIGGGKGNDAILIQDDSLQDGANLVIGGDGNDAIDFNTGLSAANLLTIEGGAGADIITVSGGALSAGNFKYSSFSDSTLSDLDQINLRSPANTTINSFVAPGVGIATASAYVINSQTATVAGGYIQSFVSAGITTLTAAVDFLDQALSTNEAVAFSLVSGGSQAFLFVQGGDTDLVVQYNSANAAVSGGTLAASGIAGGTKLEFVY